MYMFLAFNKTVVITPDVAMLQDSTQDSHCSLPSTSPLQRFLLYFHSSYSCRRQLPCCRSHNSCSTYMAWFCQYLQHHNIEWNYAIYNPTLDTKATCRIVLFSILLQFSFMILNAFSTTNWLSWCFLLYSVSSLKDVIVQVSRE